MQVVHIHFPRCAGASLRSHLAPVLPDLLADHFMWGDHPPRKDRVFFIVLRDPVERVLSLYDYIRGNRNHPKREYYGGRPLIETMRLPDIEGSVFCNGMARQLSGRDAIAKPVEDVEPALRVLRREDVVAGSFDRIDDALARLGERTGIDIPPLATRINASSRSVAPPEARLSVERKNLIDGALWASLQGDLGRLTPKPFRNRGEVLYSFSPGQPGYGDKRPVQ